jgi:uncharacterized protein (TIGR01244 family)
MRIVAALALGAAAAAQVPHSVDAALIPSYVVARAGIASGGQPTAEGLSRLKELGFRTVINLRVGGESGFVDEKVALEAQGLRYVHVPVTASTLSEADVAAVRAVLDDPTAHPVLVHCAVGSRVGAVWAVIQGRQGKSLDEAEAEGRRVGMGRGMIGAVRRLLGNRP